MVTQTHPQSKEDKGQLLDPTKGWYFYLEFITKRYVNWDKSLFFIFLRVTIELNLVGLFIHIYLEL